VATHPSLTDGLRLNLTTDLDDYPNDDEFDYSDYAYEDPIDDSLLSNSSAQTNATATTTNLPLSTTSVYDDPFIDDTDTVSYYDYVEQDMYSDDDTDGAAPASPIVSVSPTQATIFRIPSHHRRRPVMWNVTIDGVTPSSKQPLNTSISLTYSSLLHFIVIIAFILT
jgi:hypothetical protein